MQSYEVLGEPIREGNNAMRDLLCWFPVVEVMGQFMDCPEEANEKFKTQHKRYLKTESRAINHGCLSETSAWENHYNQTVQPMKRRTGLSSWKICRLGQKNTPYLADSSVQNEEKNSRSLSRQGATQSLNRSGLQPLADRDCHLWSQLRSSPLIVLGSNQ